jgi:hypothetical protein
MKIFWAISFTGVLAAAIASSFFRNNPVYPKEKQSGVCWVGGREMVTEKELSGISSLHVNWISQTPFGWQPGNNSPEIKLNTSHESIWWGESDEGLAETSRLARKQKIKTLLKPHLWVNNGWPGDVKMTSDSDWDLWFSGYETFILHYARLAEKNHFALFCIGTELQNTSGKEKEWRSLIKKIKSVYHGPLTYAANFHEEFEKIEFWDALDYIGIQAYFPLSKNKDAELNELVLGWKAPIAAIEKVQRRFNKPVIFTEIGYRSTHDAAIEPWRWPSSGDAGDACNEAQAACYRAFFETVWTKKWLAGVYFWKWYPHGPHRQGAIDFTPQGKMAEKVILEYFSK